MSSADEILFEPINKPINQTMVDAVKQALENTITYQFSVDPRYSVETYDEIARLVEDDPNQIVYVKRMVNPDTGQRPATALSIKDVFRRMHAGNFEFYFCARANCGGITRYTFKNWFAIEHRMPTLQLDKQSSRFEWWVVSLLSNFTGYTHHYAFGTWEDAHQYYGIP